MTCREAIEEIFRSEPGVLSTRDVILRIRAGYPREQWKDGTISLHLVGLSLDHPQARHHPNLQRHACLVSAGRGLYRRLRPEDRARLVPAPTHEEPELADGDMEKLAEEIQEDEAQEEDLAGAAISLERDLELFLCNNLGSLEDGLKLYGNDSLTGRQVPVDTGRIDLLAVDKDGGLVVIELKAGMADHRVCGQVLRYMGWVQKHMAGGKPVRGIVVANDFDDSLKYAVVAMPSIRLYRYKALFEFSPVREDEV